MAIDLLSRYPLILLGIAILIIIGLFLLIRIRKSRNNHQLKKEHALDVSRIADITKDEFKPARFQMATQDAIPQEKNETIPSAKPTPSVMKTGEEGRIVENPELKAPKNPEVQPGVREGSLIARNPELKAPKTPELQPVVREGSLITKNPESKVLVKTPEPQPGVSLIAENPESKAPKTPESQPGVSLIAKNLESKASKTAEPQPVVSLIAKNPGPKAPVKTAEPQPGVREGSLVAKNPESKAPKNPEPQPVVREVSVIAKTPESKAPNTPKVQPVVSLIAKTPDSKAPKTPEPQPGVPLMAKTPESKAPKTPEPQSGVSLIAMTPGSKKPVTRSEFKPAIQEKGVSLEDEITVLDGTPRKKVSKRKLVKKEPEVAVEDMEKGTKILTKRKGNEMKKPVKEAPKAIDENIIEEETGEKIKKGRGTEKKVPVQKESTV